MSLSSEEFAAAYQAGFTGTIRLLYTKGCRDRDNAMDLAQSAWARAWECRDQFRGTCRLSSWVATIAINLLRSAHRKRHVSQLPEDWNGGSYVEHPEIAIDAALLLNRCPSGIQRSLIGRYLLDLDYSEIAGATTYMSGKLMVYKARVAARARACHNGH